MRGFGKANDYITRAECQALIVHVVNSIFDQMATNAEKPKGPMDKVTEEFALFPDAPPAEDYPVRYAEHDGEPVAVLS